MNARTSPVQVVVRSSVASWIATGTPSLVSLASTSKHEAVRGRVAVGVERLLGEGGLAVDDGAAAVGVDLAAAAAVAVAVAHGRENGSNEGGSGLAAASGQPSCASVGPGCRAYRREVGPTLADAPPRRSNFVVSRTIGSARMAASEQTDLARTALDHLWLHFTEMGGYADPADLQVIVKGDGCYLEDADGRRYLDALAGLFCVNIGYGFGEEMGEAAAAQMRELPFAINWTFAHPRSIELAAELADLAPGDLNRAFFVSGGSEAVEAAWKLARQYHAARGERRWKAIARRVAYHGTTMGALSITGCTDLRTPFEPLVPDVLHVSNTNRYHRPPEETEEEFTRFLLDDLEATIEQAGPDTVAMVIMEPVQNSGGSFMPPAGYFEGVRAICDEHGILLCADEVITGFGRTGHWFASERFDIRPDLITSAKGLSSAYASIGALIASERVMEPFKQPGRDVHARHDLRRPPGAGGGRAQEHRDHAARGHRRARARERARLPRRAGARCSSCRSSATCAAAATSTRSSWSRTRHTRTSFDDDECDELLRGFVSPELFKRGLLCRADDRGDPVVQISPPLVAGPEEFEFIASTLAAVLEEAGERMHVAA